MTTVYLARGPQSTGPKLTRGRGASGVQTEQQRIRAEYLELAAHLHPTAAEWGAIERHLAALRMRCSHPDLGRGGLPGHFGQTVAPNQCPDCGNLVNVGSHA